MRGVQIDRRRQVIRGKQGKAEEKKEGKGKSEANEKLPPPPPKAQLALPRPPPRSATLDSRGYSRFHVLSVSSRPCGGSGSGGSGSGGGGGGGGGGDGGGGGGGSGVIFFPTMSRAAPGRWSRSVTRTAKTARGG